MSFAGRLMIQNCESASLDLNWDQVRSGEQQDIKKVSIARGLLVFVCFREGITQETVIKMAKAAIQTKIVNRNNAKPESAVNENCDILVIPQATLGGKVKGKQLQYHGNIKKDIGLEKYILFCSELKSSDLKIEFGTYGNRQVLSVVTEGPFSHILDF